MPLLYICMIKASSWSFTAPLFAFFNAQSKQDSRLSAVVAVLRNVLRDSSQQVPAFTKALPQVRWRCPNQGAAGDQQKWRNPRLLEPSPLRNEGRQRQYDDRADDGAAHKPERRAQKPVEPAQSHAVNSPARNPPGHSREQHDNKKYGKEPRDVCRPLRVHVLCVPGCHPRVLPSSQQISDDHPRQRKEFVKEPLRDRLQHRQQNDEHNHPVENGQAHHAAFPKPAMDARSIGYKPRHTSRSFWPPPPEVTPEPAVVCST